MAKVGVAIINYNRLEMLKRCVQSVLETSGGVVFDLLVLDVGSTDDSSVWLIQETRHGGLFTDRSRFFAIEEPGPSGVPRTGYAQSVNQAARKMFEDHPEMEYFYTLNNDCYVQPGWLSACVETFATDSKIGHVGSSVWYGPSFPQLDGKVQSAGAFFLFGSGQWVTRSAYIGQKTVPTAPFDVDYTGFGMYRRDMFEEFGGLCEDYPPIYWDDPDWGFTLWENGYRVVCNPMSMIVHDHTPNPYTEPERQHHFVSIGPNKEKFMKKWKWMLTPLGNRNALLPPVVGC